MEREVNRESNCNWFARNDPQMLSVYSTAVSVDWAVSVGHIRTLGGGILPVSIKEVGVFYSPIRLGKKRKDKYTWYLLENLKKKL